jgi:AcrR family transcriptional regulator
MRHDVQEGRLPGAVAVVRRAPFSDNPRVGAKGRLTRQRILDAALRAFGDNGYRACSVDEITRIARCSRVAFYQYFASKEEVFRNLAEQVAHQVIASTETLDPVTADLEGWTALRAWVGRYAEIHARYEPVFHALEGDEVLAVVARHTGEPTFTWIRARFATTTLPPRHVDRVIRLLLECLNHTFDVSATLRSVAPDAYPPEAVEIALTDIVHRTLFGLCGGVNVHTPASSPPPSPATGSEILALLQPRRTIDAAPEPGRPLDPLLAAARDVFVAKGYHDTRVEDLIAAAGISRSAFYRRFHNKEQLARVLTAAAVRAVGNVVLDIPDVAALETPAAKDALRRWLRRYVAVQVDDAAMQRVWVDAALQAPALRAESSPLLEWGRRRMSRFLQPRGFGDVDTEAVVMVALLGVFGARPRPAAEVDAAAQIIERGLLGADQ